MLGSGIFVLPGVAFDLTGPSLYLAYFFAALCILPAAVSKSELATAMPTSGGTYVYLERTFGPLAGTVAGLGLYLSLLLKAAFALVGFGAYLELLANVPIQMTAMGLLGLIIALNIFGVGKASSFVAVIVFTSVASLLGLSVFATLDIQPQNFTPFLTQGNVGLISATALVFVAFAGVTKVAAIAEEIKDPGYNLPRGILFSLVLVTVIYSGVTFVMIGNLSPQELSGNLRPVFSLAEKVGGSNIGIIAAVISILTMTSMANAGILAASRFPFAMSRDNLLPPIFGKIDAKFLTPIWSIVASGLIVGAAIVLMDVEKIVKLASAFMIIIYMIENIAVIVLREMRVQWYQPTYKSFAYPGLQLFGIATSVVLLFAMGAIVPLAILTVSVPGVILYLMFSRKRTDRRGVLGIRGPRKDLVEDLASTHRVADLTFEEDASVVVAMFGNERSPEVLSEMGVALADGNKLEVVHLTEIPEQTDLDDIEDESVQIRSIRRRVNHMSQRQNANVEFDPIVSHDIMKSVSDISQRLHCAWFVMEWGGKTRGALTLHNPIGWLRDHLSCHLMTFTDKGVRYFKKILVIVQTRKSNELLLRTADHLARVHEAEITLSTYTPQDGDKEINDWQKELLEGMKKRSQHAVDTLIVTGKNEWEAYSRATDEFDLVIIESERIKSPYKRFFGGSTYDKLMEHSVCSVVSVQPSTPHLKDRSLRAKFSKK